LETRRVRRGISRCKSAVARHPGRAGGIAGPEWG
jgi:hypothetical protein